MVLIVGKVRQSNNVFYLFILNKYEYSHIELCPLSITDKRWVLRNSGASQWIHPPRQQHDLSLRGRLYI